MLSCIPGWSRVASGEREVSMQKGQHKSSCVTSGDDTLSPVELFMVQDSAPSEKNTAASSKGMVTGHSAVPS